MELSKDRSLRGALRVVARRAPMHGAGIDRLVYRLRERSHPSARETLAGNGLTTIDSESTRLNDFGIGAGKSRQIPTIFSGV
jgi:hypothetical protein